MNVLMNWCPFTRLFAVFCFVLLAAMGCSSQSAAPGTGGGAAGNVGGAGTGGVASDTGGVASDTGGATSGTGGAPLATGGAGASTQPAATGGATSKTDAGAATVAVTLSETTYTFATPDLSHALTAIVTGTTNTTVTWTSSNTYIATVDANGVVTSVSGGEATITAKSAADPTKSASATVTIAEPNRPKAATYVDAKSIVSGPVSIIMCGDSLMRTYAVNAADQTGWGQVLGQFFTADVAVDNTLPNGGRSSRSFYNEVGRWDVAKTRLQAAFAAGMPTFVVIMFGHNDEKKVTDTDGPLYLTFASQNQNGTVAGTYYDYLERYIVETRELGGIPVLLTPFVREYLAGTPPTVTDVGQHNVTAPYTGETTARGDYPAAIKAVAAKHDVPVVDITGWSKSMVEARAVAGTLGYLYIASDQTHIRNLGALLVAQQAAKSLSDQGILTNYARTVPARVMLDANTLAFGGLYAGNTLDKTFRISPFGDVSGTLTVSAPNGYTLSTDGIAFVQQASVNCDTAYVGNVVTVRFAPTDTIAYNADITVAHTSLTPDYGNTTPNATAGAVSLTGNGKAIVSGSPASVTWAMFSGTTIALDAATSGPISATPATLTGLVNKNVAYNAARFDTPDGTWPAEGARNASRYVEFKIPVSSGSFTLDSISVDAGTGGGSNMHWDIVYSLTTDFSSPTALGTALGGAKDTLATSSFPSLGVNVAAGQTLTLRVYPYNSSAATGKSLMLANVVISGVTN
jgi:lysophospholipase L1-like esterase